MYGSFDFGIEYNFLIISTFIVLMIIFISLILDTYEKIKNNNSNNNQFIENVV